MPFRSKAQMRFMFAKKPGMASEFADKTKSMKSLPERVAYGGVISNKPSEHWYFNSSGPRDMPSQYARGGDVPEQRSYREPLEEYLDRLPADSDADDEPIHTESDEPEPERPPDPESKFWRGGEANPGLPMQDWHAYGISGYERDPKSNYEYRPGDSAWNTPGEGMLDEGYEHSDYEAEGASEYSPSSRSWDASGGDDEEYDFLTRPGLGHQENYFLGGPVKGEQRELHELGRLTTHRGSGPEWGVGESQPYPNRKMAMGGHIQDVKPGHGYAYGGMGYADGGYINEPYAEDETSKREESWEYPESESNVYSEADEPEKWTEVGDFEENPDVDSEEEYQKSHAKGQGFQLGGVVNPTVAPTANMPQHVARARFARALMNRRR